MSQLNKISHKCCSLRFREKMYSLAIIYINRAGGLSVLRAFSAAGLLGVFTKYSELFARKHSSNIHICETVLQLFYLNVLANV